jgi:hypothetical protein
MAIRRMSLITTIVAAGLMLAAGGALAYAAKPIYFKGYAAGSFINTPFTFEYGSDGINTQVGYDSIAGQSLQQVVSEYYDAYDSCSASDGTLGEEFYLYEYLGIGTYLNGGQIYTYADEETECVSLTTGVYSGSGPFYIIGGSGKLAGGSGSGQDYFTGQFLGDPAKGFFGSVQASWYGTVTP